MDRWRITDEEGVLVKYNGRRTFYTWPVTVTNPADGYKWTAQIDGGIYASGRESTRRKAKYAAQHA